MCDTSMIVGWNCHEIHKWITCVYNVLGSRAKQCVYKCFQAVLQKNLLLSSSSCWAPGRTRQICWLYWSYLFEGLIDQHPYSSIIARPSLLSASTSSLLCLVTGNSANTIIRPSPSVPFVYPRIRLGWLQAGDEKSPQILSHFSDEPPRPGIEPGSSVW